MPGEGDALREAVLAAYDRGLTLYVPTESAARPWRELFARLGRPARVVVDAECPPDTVYVLDPEDLGP